MWFITPVDLVRCVGACGSLFWQARFIILIAWLDEKVRCVHCVVRRGACGAPFLVWSRNVGGPALVFGQGMIYWGWYFHIGESV